MNDDEVLGTVRTSLMAARDSLSQEHMRCPVEQITARARSRRQRRLAGLAALGVAAGVAVAVPLAAAGQNGTVAAGAPLAVGGQGAAQSVHVDLAAWSIDSTPGGTVSVTIRELQRPALLRSDLAKAGVPAFVYFNESCEPNQALPGINGQQEADLAVEVMPAASALRGGAVEFTVNKALMPKGAEITLGLSPTTHFKNGTLLSWATGLAPVDAQMSCTAGPVRPTGFRFGSSARR